MIVAWIEKALVLSPQTSKDEQALNALAAACPGIARDTEPPRNVCAQGSGATEGPVAQRQS